MQPRWKFFVGLMAFTVTLRLMPYVMTNYDVKLDPSVYYYPWNFSPLMAISLFAGANLSDRRFRFGLPLLTLLLSDLGIWGVTGQFSWAFPPGYWSSYACNIFAVLLGTGLNSRTGMSRMFAAAGRGVLAEIVFFVITNFVYFLTQTDHPHNLAGLAACYIAAIPFAQTSFVSTAFYSTMLFSGLANRATLGSKASETRLQPVHST